MGGYQLAKDGAQLSVLFALSNPWIVLTMEGKTHPKSSSSGSLQDFATNSGLKWRAGTDACSSKHG